MRAVVIDQPGRVSVTDLPEPEPQMHEVLLRVVACGLCGTDVHTVAGSNPMAQYPCIPGHEFSGQVIRVGTRVSRLAVGDFVSVDPSRSCGECQLCRRGQPNLCPRKGGLGSRLPGGFAECVAVDADTCERIPAGVDPSHGALAEPLACVLHAIDRLGTVLGDDVLVYGAGSIGLMTAELLRLGGAASISMVDRSPDRLATLPDSIGARALSASDLPLSDWDIVIDATGAPPAIADGLGRVRAAGRFLVLGVAPPDSSVPLNPYDVYRREITIIGSMALVRTFTRAVALLADPRLDLGRLISHLLPLDEFETALDMVRAGQGRKILITPNGVG